jgi:hypothetical protein
MARRSKRLTVIAQRHKMDCGIAALAMLLGLSYERVSVIAYAIAADVATTGLNLKEIQAIAQHCGVSLDRHRTYNLETGLGILSVRRPTWWHCVILRQGIIVDPNAGRIFEARDYLSSQKARACTLLVRGTQEATRVAS